MATPTHDKKHASDKDTAKKQRKPRAAPQTPGTSRVHADRTRSLIAGLEDRTAHAHELIASGRGTDMRSGEIDAVREQLSRARGELQRAVTQLPSGDPLMMQAFAASDRATSALSRLDAVSRALHARDATAGEAAQGDKSELFAAAAKKTPQGYCDASSTPQEMAPCELDPQTRQNYRTSIRDVVHSAQLNWTAAINALQVAEKFKSKEVTFEQKLGELILGALFGVVGLAGKAIAGKAIAAGAKGLTVESGNFPGIADGPSPGLVSLVKKGAEKGIDKGVKKLNEAAKSMTVEDLTARSTPGMPADREGFLEACKSAPTIWASNITSNLNLLFDADLAALSAGLPSISAITQRHFEDRLSAILHAFERQVMRIDSSVRPVKVMNAHGMIRVALVAPETERNASLPGQWRGTPSLTGKKLFLGWVDTDMQEMAMETGARGVWRPDPGVLMNVRRTNDADYWAAQSLGPLLAWDFEHAIKQDPPDAQDRYASKLP